MGRQARLHEATVGGHCQRALAPGHSSPVKRTLLNLRAVVSRLRCSNPLAAAADAALAKGAVGPAKEPEVDARAVENVAATGQAPDDIAGLDVRDADGALALRAHGALLDREHGQSLDFRRHQARASAGNGLAGNGLVAGQVADLAPTLACIVILDGTQLVLRAADAALQDQGDGADADMDHEPDIAQYEPQPREPELRGGRHALRRLLHHMPQPHGPDARPEHEEW
mmetsp:Transcript_18120/g.51675  ORF Transcript_18120/g.51675 Transcript_18120/m.51675 type:complete len:227 (-) Transcript_18120:403-1083(-)